MNSNIKRYVDEKHPFLKTPTRQVFTYIIELIFSAKYTKSPEIQYQIELFQQKLKYLDYYNKYLLNRDIKKQYVSKGSHKILSATIKNKNNIVKISPQYSSEDITLLKELLANLAIQYDIRDANLTFSDMTYYCYSIIDIALPVQFNIQFNSIVEEETISSIEQRLSQHINKPVKVRQIP